MTKIFFEINDEEIEKVKELIADFKKDGFTDDDAYRAIFEMGIKAYLIEKNNPDEDELRKQLIMLASKYSAVKFKNFQLMRDNQTLDIKLKGYESENRYLRGISGIRVDDK